jgi:hypothetical protein
MDPGRVVIDVPTVNGGALLLARFCRDLAREATRIAADLDPGHGLPKYLYTVRAAADH